MKTNKTNSTALHIWIAENGDVAAKEAICKAAQITQSTLSRVLSKGRMPRFEARYRIFKLTGIKLCDSDEFPEQKQNAS